MSRIEEALKRAKEAGQGTTPMPAAPVAPSPGAVPMAEVFHDPWAVEDAAPPAPWPPALFAAAAASDVPAEEPSPSGGAPPVPPDDPSGETVPPTPALALFEGVDPTVAERVVATSDTRPAFVEQYRKLAGVLHHAQLEKNIRVVMVASAVSGEGKSLTATNLALTFSESYHRTVLLIDADLRRPTLHETFQVPNISGLSDGLRAEKENRLTLVQVSPRLTLLTAGRPDPDPMSGLTSGRMTRVIEEAASRFDWVIIDTPPVGLLPDAKLLAAMADTTLFVIRAGRTPYALIRRAVESIGRERILGIVLNCADPEAGNGGYGYHSYYDAYSERK